MLLLLLAYGQLCGCIAPDPFQNYIECDNTAQSLFRHLKKIGHGDMYIQLPKDSGLIPILVDLELKVNNCLASELGEFDNYNLQFNAFKIAVISSINGKHNLLFKLMREFPLATNWFMPALSKIQDLNVNHKFPKITKLYPFFMDLKVFNRLLNAIPNEKDAGFLDLVMSTDTFAAKYFIRNHELSPINAGIQWLYLLTHEWNQDIFMGLAHEGQKVRWDEDLNYFEIDIGPTVLSSHELALRYLQEIIPDHIAHVITYIFFRSQNLVDLYIINNLGYPKEQLCKGFMRVVEEGYEYDIVSIFIKEYVFKSVGLTFDLDFEKFLISCTFNVKCILFMANNDRLQYYILSMQKEIAETIIRLFYVKLGQHIPSRSKVNSLTTYPLPSNINSDIVYASFKAIILI